MPRATGETIEAGAVRLAEADALLRQAEAIRNADHWSGPRDAPAQTAALMALGYAALAIAGELGAIRGELASVARATYTAAGP